MTVTATIRTYRRHVPGGPVIIDLETIDFENSTIEAALRSGGANEDGTFEICDIAGVSLKSTHPSR